ncbi:hypothetical protein B0H13DRAFT_1851547 [Mycena leptocephala]|nr:hypothetical protein B0H13DRAFT_1851547 [Mycena leptocephala]
MVNFLHNIAALMGAATLSNSIGANGAAVVGFPLTLSSTNQEWLLIPQTTAGTFTLQSVSQPQFFLSYAAAGVTGIVNAPVVVSNASRSSHHGTTQYAGLVHVELHDYTGKLQFSMRFSGE